MKNYFLLLLCLIQMQSIAQRNGKIDADTLQESTTGLSIAFVKNKLVVNDDINNRKFRFISEDSVTNKLRYKLEKASSKQDFMRFDNSTTECSYDGSVWKRKTGFKLSDGGDFPGTIYSFNSLYYWEREFEGDILVEWFGAKADGSTICTDAFQKAVNVRQFSTPYGWNRNITGKGNGVYLTGNIVLPADGTITIKGSGLYGMYLKLISGENKPMFTVPAGDCVPYFENLVMDGNKENQQDSTSHGIEYKDAVDSTYRRAGMIMNCNIINFKGDGIHGGRYKQLLRVTNTDVRDNDGHGLFQPLYNADWFINSGDFGNNGKCNFYISSQVQIINASIYFAGQHNIYLGQHTRWSSIVANIIDHANEHGIFVEGNPTNPCEVNIMGNRFYDNSLLSDNTSSDIYLKDANGVGVVNNSFIAVPGQNTGHVKYLVETNNSTKTSFLNNTWRFDSYITGITNDLSVLGNQENVSVLGELRTTGNIRNTKNISFTETISAGSTTGNLLGVNKVAFGSGDPSQTLGAGKIGRNTNNTQLQIDYGTEGIVFRNNGNVVGFFMDPLQRAFINTTTTVASAQFGIFSNNRGFLPPVQTTTERNGISNPVAGLIVYDNTIKDLMVHDGTSWGPVGSISGQYTTTASSTTEFILSIGTTMPNTNYKVFYQPLTTNAVGCIVTNKGTTTFTLNCPSASGTFSVDWQIER